jgi:hypothetical protein
VHEWSVSTSSIHPLHRILVLSVNDSLLLLLHLDVSLLHVHISHIPSSTINALSETASEESKCH